MQRPSIVHHLVALAAAVALTLAIATTVARLVHRAMPSPAWAASAVSPRAAGGDPVEVSIEPRRVEVIGVRPRTVAGERARDGHG